MRSRSMGHDLWTLRVSTSHTPSQFHPPPTPEDRSEEPCRVGIPFPNRNRCRPDSVALRPCDS